jgi:hypothetical protein
MNTAERLRDTDYRAPTGIQMTSDEANERARQVCGISNCGQPVMPPSTICHDCDSETEAMRRYLRARELYLREMVRGPTWRDRAGVWFAGLWHKIWGGVVLIIATTFLTIGLCAEDTTRSGYWTTAEVTAYCPCALCCGTHDRTTANNTSTDAVPYAFAADRSLPFGASVFVPVGLGVLDRVRADERWFGVDDRGGALDTEARRYGVLRLDLRVRDHGWAVRFGRRTLPVFVTVAP